MLDGSRLPSMNSTEGPLLAALALLALYVVVDKRVKSQKDDLGLLPRARGGHWFWGHEKEAWETPNFGFHTRNFEEKGQVYRMKGALFHPDILVLADPGAIAHVFTKRCYAYSKGIVMRALGERITGRSLFWVEGDEHKRQHQMLAPIFTHENVKHMSDEINVASNKLIVSLGDHIRDSSDVKSNQGDADLAEINILKWTWKVSLDVIGSVGFGYDFRHGEDPDGRAIHESWAAMAVLGMTFPGFVAPLVLRACPWIADLPVKSIQAQGEIKTTIHRLGRKVIADRKKLEDGEELNKKDLLSTLIRLNGDQPLELLLDQICVFSTAGNETVSEAVNYTLYYLAHHKSAQDRLRQELRDHSAEPTYEDFQLRLPYLDAVCKEALRLCPPLSHVERIATEDDIIPLRFPITNPRTGEPMTSFRIRKGQTFLVHSMPISRQKSIWGDDADDFKPHRWLPSGSVHQDDGPVSPLPPQSSLPQGWGGTLAFSEGPRKCIGERFGLFEYKVILSKLINAFEFLPSATAPSGGKIEIFHSTMSEPFIVGRLDLGAQIPLRIRFAAE
ncbi:hypothetical protein FRB94_009661 [Tulasnella sp. JGI-2019a]|nr:hypothetical protein FRB94_009661 [Tulasnella sp. JGI-2019a]KAG8997473.1 hypothetical protein FRB93_014084 [Tulasnella sp. JGI-2019a]KAG9023312.1 hypothetical protein FRB95_013266 [Tulasnella sp. JGI-2019a]